MSELEAFFNGSKGWALRSKSLGDTVTDSDGFTVHWRSKKLAMGAMESVFYDNENEWLTVHPLPKS